jgi:hypothetical protein
MHMHHRLVYGLLQRDDHVQHHRRHDRMWLGGQSVHDLQPRDALRRHGVHLRHPVVVHRMLRRERGMSAEQQRHLRKRRQCLHEMWIGTGLRRIGVWLHAELLPERLLQWNDLPALRESEQDHVWFRHHVRELRHGTEMQHQQRPMRMRSQHLRRLL